MPGRRQQPGRGAAGEAAHRERPEHGDQNREPPEPRHRARVHAARTGLVHGADTHGDGAHGRRHQHAQRRRARGEDEVFGAHVRSSGKRL